MRMVSHRAFYNNRCPESHMTQGRPSLVHFQFMQVGPELYYLILVEPSRLYCSLHCPLKGPQTCAKLPPADQQLRAPPVDE